MAAAPLPDVAEDPEDPRVILRDLPERERTRFLASYREAAAAAIDPVGYGELRRTLHFWSLVVVATNSPGYYERTSPDRVKGQSVAAEDVIPDFQARLAAAIAAKA